jgi:F-type H+-transporting ATPase subunit a
VAGTEAAAAQAAEQSHDVLHSLHEHWSWFVQIFTNRLHIHGYEWLVVSWLLIALIGFLCWRVTSRLTVEPTGLQNFLEYIYEWLEQLVLGMMGPAGKPYVPLVGTVFLYILSMNMIGVIPGFVSPTSNINCTAALAVLITVSVHCIAIANLGFKGYLLHLCGEPLWLAPLMLPIHLVSEFLAKPLSLAVRLFGNIFGEDQVVVNLTALGLTIFQQTYVPIPLQFPLLAFGLFTSFVQALVFAMLTAVYIGLFVAEHGEHDSSHVAHSGEVTATAHSGAH